MTGKIMALAEITLLGKKRLNNALFWAIIFAILFFIPLSFFMLCTSLLVGLILYFLADFIGQHTRLSYRISFFLVLFLIALFVAGIVLLSIFGGEKVKVMQQAREFYTEVQQWWQAHQDAPILRQLKLNQINWQNLLFKGFSNVGAVFSILAALLLALLAGLFIAFSPKEYKKDVEKFFEKILHRRINPFFKQSRKVLSGWLQVRVIMMAFFAIASGIFFFIINLPYAFLFAILTGLLTFIPNFGPILTLIPLGLVAATQSMQTFWMVIGFYLGLQLIESNLITPFFLKQKVQTPPALVLISQFLLGALFGTAGLLYAAPIFAVLYHYFLEPEKKK